MKVHRSPQKTEHAAHQCGQVAEIIRLQVCSFRVIL